VLAERAKSRRKCPNRGIFRAFGDQKLAMARFDLQATLRCDTPAAVRRDGGDYCA
jgi:hypothetical protein